MVLHYLTFMGRNLENRKKATLVHVMNIVGTNSKNVVNIVGICKYTIVINVALVNNINMKNVLCK